jgi:hypothetical protein
MVIFWLVSYLRSSADVFSRHEILTDDNMHDSGVEDIVTKIRR